MTAAQGAEFVVVSLRMRCVAAPADGDRPLQHTSWTHRSAISAADMCQDPSKSKILPVVKLIR